MTHATGRPTPSPMKLERRYQAAVQDLWRLWTTKEGFESWWGPNGFRVEVHKIEPRVGGELLYDMIAVAPEQVAYMEKANMPLSHATRGTFVEVEPLQALAINHHIDFIPGVPPYDNRARVQFFQEGKSVRMVITVDAHHDPHWTQMATAGWESQLGKVPAALGAPENGLRLQGPAVPR